MPRDDDKFSPEDADALCEFLQHRRDDADGGDLTKWPLTMLLDATEDFLFNAHKANDERDAEEVEILMECCIDFIMEIQQRFFPRGDDEDDGDDGDDEPAVPDDSPGVAETPVGPPE